MNKVILFFLIGLYAVTGVHAQIEESSRGKEAEELFESIFPLGIGLGIEYAPLKENGNRGDFNFGQSDLWIPEVEFTYNIFQKNRFNLRAGIKTRFFQYRSFMPLSSGNYSTREPTELIHMRLGEYTWNVPLTAEYIRALSDDSWLAVHAGYELQYYRNNPLKEISERTVPPNGHIELRELSFNDRFGHGFNVGAGVYQKIGRKLMKFELNYHFHVSRRLIHQELHAGDLPDHPNVLATNSWSGNRLDAKVTFYLFNK